MAAQPDICNDALTLIGAATIAAITDQVASAYALNAVWNLERDSELRAHVWKFAIARAQLPALVTAPVNGPYNTQFALPSGCLRILAVGDSNYDYPAVDLSDYRSSPTDDDYVIEGGNILSNWSAPLSVRYVQQVTDCTLWDSAFCACFAARLASRVCYRLTQSHDGEKVAMQRYQLDLSAAIRANALETTPTQVADDSWIATRPVGSGGAPWIRYG